MTEVADYNRMILAVSLAVGLIVSGLGNALIAPRSRMGQYGVVFFGIGISTVTATLLQSPWNQQIGLYGVGLVVTILVARLENVQRCWLPIFYTLSSHRLRWAMLGTFGIVGLLVELDRFQQRDSENVEQSMAYIEDVTRIVSPVPVSDVEVMTDRGHRLHPVTAASPRTLEEMTKQEARTLSELPIKYQVIHRAPPNDLSNCHGWVFTGGRYSILGEDVETILADHQYVEYQQPSPGDLCVYRDSRGAISHTALVRAICNDGNVLVEGKWGWLGVYLHLVDDSCYGTSHHYYHTSRNTHLLNIIPSTSAAVASNHTP